MQTDTGGNVVYRSVFLSWQNEPNCLRKFFFFSLGLLFKYLQVGDLEGAVFHQADSTVISQDPLAVFFPLDAGDGVSHDVAV